MVYQNITTELLAFHHRLILKKRKEEYIFKSFWFYLNSLNFVNFQILNYIFQSDCYNFIKILLVHKDEILVCGTNAFDPRCTWRAVSITVTTTICVHTMEVMFPKWNITSPAVNKHIFDVLCKRCSFCNFRSVPKTSHKMTAPLIYC